MNKQSYLAELQRLLVFMTEEDRQTTVRRYSDIFDAAGEGNEVELVARIGSPTKAAIGLSRGYEPGNIKNLPEDPAVTKKETVSFTQNQEDPWGDLPAFEIPAMDTASLETEESEREAPAEPVPEAETEEIPSGEMPEESAAEEPPAEPAPEQAEETGEISGDKTDEKTGGLPLGVGIPLFVLVTLAIGIPLAALCVAVMAALLCPGAAGIAGAYFAAVGGLWCMSYLADAILLFGLAFLLLAVGLLILWGGIWLDSKLFDLYVRGVSWLGGELFGKKVDEHA